MKKQIALSLLIALVGFSSNLMAQNDIKAGLVLAPNFSFFTKKTAAFSECDTCKGSVGFSVGYFETLELNSRFQLEANILYTQNNFKNDESGDLKATYSIRYIDIPFLIRYKSGNIRLGVGGQYRYGMEGKSSFMESSNVIEKANDLGFVLDLGIEQQNARFGLRLYQGSEDVIIPVPMSSATFYLGFTMF